MTAGTSSASALAAALLMLHLLQDRQYSSVCWALSKDLSEFHVLHAYLLRGAAKTFNDAMHQRLTTTDPWLNPSAGAMTIQHPQELFAVPGCRGRH